MAKSDEKGSLADQLAGLSISVEESKEEEPAEPEQPPRPPSDEEVFARAMEGLSDDQLAEQMARKAPKVRERGNMADAMESVLDDIKPVASKRRRPAEPAAPKGPAAPQKSQSLPDDRPLSDEELFAAAVDGLAPDDVYRGKYLGHSDVPESADGPSISDFMETQTYDEIEGETATEETTRERVKDLQNKNLLERALGGVDKKLDHSKYRKKQSKPPVYSSEPNTELNTEPLPKSGDGLNDVELQPAQAELLKRYNKAVVHQAVPELNLRGDTLEDALRRLELFAHDCWKNESGFMRIIHGKGHQSDGDPVIKPAVLKWLEGPGFRYIRGIAPEVKRAGNYGSVIVELERKR